jgi:hypothetical protein
MSRPIRHHPPAETPVPTEPGAGRSAPTTSRPATERGQATAEYALVLLGAAAVALMLAAWAAQTGKLGELFDAVVDQLIGRAG